MKLASAALPLSNATQTHLDKWEEGNVEIINISGERHRQEGVSRSRSAPNSCHVVSSCRDKCRRCCTFRRSQACRDGFCCIGVSVIAPPPSPSPLQQVTVSREVFCGCSSDPPVLKPACLFVSEWPQSLLPWLPCWC